VIKHLLWGLAMMADMLLGFLVFPPLGWLFVYPVYRELKVVFEVMDEWI